MEDWIFEWSHCDGKQCWWEVSQLWQSNGFRKSLTNQQIPFESSRTTVNQGELVEDSMQLVIGWVVQQNSWCEVLPWGLPR